MKQNKKVAAKVAANPTKKPAKVKVEKVVFRVRTFANGEVWADTKYGTYKSGAVGKDKFDAIANCANWANRMIAIRNAGGVDDWREFGAKMKAAWERVTLNGGNAECELSGLMDDLDDLLKGGK